jgi:hypothetical protein
VAIGQRAMLMVVPKDVSNQLIWALKLTPSKYNLTVLNTVRFFYAYHWLQCSLRKGKVGRKIIRVPAAVHYIRTTLQYNQENPYD